MMHAVVLIKAGKTDVTVLGGGLVDIEGVQVTYSVTGEWDLVAIIAVRDLEDVAELVTARIAQLEGVASTKTLVAFRAFSRHNLEQIFTIGAADHELI